MIVSNLQDYHTPDLIPFGNSMLVSRNGLLVRYKNHSIRLIEIASPLTLSITNQLVVFAREISNIFQRFSVQQIAQASVKELCAKGTHLLLTSIEVVGQSC